MKKNQKKTLRRAAGCTPRPIRTMPDWLSAGRPIRTKSDRFGVWNGSARWRCPKEDDGRSIIRVRPSSRCRETMLRRLGVVTLCSGRAKLCHPSVMHALRHTTMTNLPCTLVGGGGERVVMRRHESRAIVASWVDSTPEWGNGVVDPDSALRPVYITVGWAGKEYLGNFIQGCLLIRDLLGTLFEPKNGKWPDFSRFGRSLEIC
jgi:hypothetical protein